VAGETSGIHSIRSKGNPVVTTAPDPAPDAEHSTTPWAERPAAAAANAFGVNPDQGLSADKALQRLQRYGPNALPEAAPKSKIVLLLEQFKNRLILVLVVAAGVAFFVSGEVKDPIIIAVVVLINAVLGFAQESRAEASLAALKRMLVSTARVRRNGNLIEISAEEVVVGDIAILHPGDRVPADGRWLLASDLEVDESAFTGESLPVRKQADPVGADAPLAEQKSMGFMNTTVTRGRGELVVTATGSNTEIGKLAGMLRDADPGKSPLQKQIDQLANRLTIIAGGAVAAVAVLGLVRSQPFSDVLLNAVALAVAAIPEGLPAVLTVTLAIGVHQLAKRQAIIKRLASVETLGCTTVICTDKTGTLTLNRMTAVTLWHDDAHHPLNDSEGMPIAVPETSRSLLVAGVLCNDSRMSDNELVGDPTEGALLGAASLSGLDVDEQRGQWPRIAEIPFDSATKIMATFHRADDDPNGDVRVCVKGAPDVVLNAVLDEQVRAAAIAANETLGNQGLRVLGVAERIVPATDFDPTDLQQYLDDLHLLGLYGIQDPPRPEARDAIALCRKAGIQVKMITGDHAVTAGAIADQLGLRGEVVTGAQLNEMSDEELSRRVDDIAVFARVSPEHKVRLVNVLRSQGEIVAMTGDGVNDAPALKSADIGVAMGITGTEVTKEAATMVLADDNFATIVSAVRGGRSIYDNIIKFVRFQLATNMGAILTIFTATLFTIPAGGGVFFTPIALLWVNIIMDGPPALALGVDPPDPDVMDRNPRDPREQILTGARIARMAAMAVVMMAGTIGVYLYAAGEFGKVDEITHARASLMAFTTFVLFQMFNMFSARFERLSVFGRHTLTNGKLWIALATVLALQVLAVVWDPLQKLITGDSVVATLSPIDWLLMTVIAASIVLAAEVIKLFDRLRTRRSEPEVIAQASAS